MPAGLTIDELLTLQGYVIDGGLIEAALGNNSVVRPGPAVAKIMASKIDLILEAYPNILSKYSQATL
jgi:hypothetical protein